jgi:hypothetical protein
MCGFYDIELFHILDRRYYSLFFTCKQKDLHFVHMFQAERDGSNEYSNYQPGSLNTTDQLIKDLDNI